MNNVIPEMEGWDEIDRLTSDDRPSQQAKGLGKALRAVTLGLVNARLAIGAVGTATGAVQRRLEELNTNLKDAGNSSDRLTQAIKNITLAATIIAGIALVIAVLSLGFEVYKYLYPLK